MIKHNISCPKCIASDGLMVHLEDLKCPQCNTEFIILANKLIEKGNDKFEFSTCPDCGGRLVYHSFMIPDGHDDVDWDSEEWCENPECKRKTPAQFIETHTEFGKVKPEDNTKEVKIL